MKKVKDFLHDASAYLCAGLVVTGGVMGVAALAFAVIALLMMIPAAMLWFVLPMIGYTVEFWKLWVICIRFQDYWRTVVWSQCFR